MMMVMLTTMAANAYWTLIIHRHCSKWFTHINPLDLNNFMLLLLSRFSRVRLCVTPEMAAHQAPPSLGFSRQEHWSGLPFPSPMHESEKWKWSHSVVSNPQRPHGLQPSRLLRPWDFPGKSTVVGCHCLLQPSISMAEKDSRVQRASVRWLYLTDWPCSLFYFFTTSNSCFFVLPVIPFPFHERSQIACKEHIKSHDPWANFKLAHRRKWDR